MTLRRNKSDRSWRSVQADAEDVLHRRKRLRAPELVALIHEVNPSGRELPDDVRASRYALKSRLQSVLIRDFGDELELTAEPMEAHTVALRYRPQDRDACHAVLDELDPDARAWVRLRLDLGERGGEEVAAPRLPGPVAKGAKDSLELGRRALEEYDFDAARAAFEDAFEASRGDGPAALALLELLVDQLASYGDALALAERISPEAARIPGVRERLATAAAHQGDVALTLRWLEGAVPSTTAETLVVLARQVLAQGELDRAAELVAKARAADFVCGSALTLEDELSRRRATARAPMEAELERLHALGDDAVTEAQARKLLASFPDSPIAGRMLRAIEARRARAEAKRLCQRGEEAFAAGNFILAAQLFRQAEALGESSASDRLSAALSADDDASRRRRIDKVVQGLRANLGVDSLEAWVQLPPADREQVRAILKRPELEWAERADSAAAVALAGASALPVDIDFERVLRLLEPHARTLARLPEALQLMERARAAREHMIRRTVESLLSQATGALDAGRPEDVVSALRECRRAVSRSGDPARSGLGAAGPGAS